MPVNLEDLTAEQFFAMTPEEIFLYAATLYTEQIWKLKQAVSDEWFPLEFSTGSTDLFTLDQWIAAYQRAEALNNKKAVLSDLYFIKYHNMTPREIKEWVGRSRPFYEKRKQYEADVVQMCKGLKREGELKGSEWLDILMEEFDKKESDSSVSRLQS